MSWVLLADGRIVDWTGIAELGDPAATGDPRGGIVVGAGGMRGTAPEYVGNRREVDRLMMNVVVKGSRLSRGDPTKFEQHFKDHRDLLIRATGNQYPVSTEGETAFLSELSRQIATGCLRPVGAGTLAK